MSKCQNENTVLILEAEINYLDDLLDDHYTNLDRDDLWHLRYKRLRRSLVKASARLKELTSD